MLTLKKQVLNLSVRKAPTPKLPPCPAGVTLPRLLLCLGEPPAQPREGGAHSLLRLQASCVPQARSAGRLEDRGDLACSSTRGFSEREASTLLAPP